MKTFVIRHCRAAATSFVIAAAAALAPAAGCATRPATGSATVAVTRVVPSETEIPGRRLPFDPVFLRSQFDVIRSTPVLSPVVLSNDLGAVLDAAYGWHMACPDAAADRAVACLRAWTDLSIWRDTDLIGIEVSVDRAVPGAEALSRKLAFDIARSYRANAIALREAETKAAVAQLQSEIDFLQKRLAESKQRVPRRAWESRRAQLAKRLEWPGTLVPYAEVAVIGEPRVAASAPAQADPATNALPAGLPGLYHSRGRPYSSGLVEIDESGRMSAEDRDAKWHPVPATQRKLSPVGTIRPAPEAGPGLLAFTSDETGPDGKRGVGTLAFDADRNAIHWLAYDKEHARPWTVEFAETGFFYEPREDLIRLDTDLATLWCDTIYRTEPSDGGVTEIVYSLWDHVGNLTPQQRRDLDEILARKIHSLSTCRAMMHLDDDLGAPLRNPCDGKPDPILDVSPDLRPAITKLSPEKTHAESAETAEPEPRAESAEGAELLSEQVGVGSRPDEGEDKHVVANEVDE